MLELIPVVMSEDMENRNTSNSNKNEENLDVKEVQYDEDSSSLDEQQIVSYGGLQFTLHRDGIATALGREGSLVEVDVDVSTTADDNSEGVSSLSKKLWKLVAAVPEKSNITCNIAKGNINVISKLEGDVHLSTSDGDIKVSKLRGHDVTLNNSCVGRSDDGVISSPPGLIYVQKGIEAQTVRINSSNRVRARMVNGSDVSVQVKVPSSFAIGKEEGGAMNGKRKDEHDINKLDEDDAGFRIDIGSLYISGSSECEAVLSADDDTASTTGLIRVKSSHGHVMAHAKSKRNASFARLQSQTNPFVDLGGVNGSCDVALEVGGDRMDEIVHSPVSHDEASPVATRVHFDSLSPDSISTITSSHSGEVADEAIVSVTVDRKVEADVRLLSLDSGAESMSIDIDHLTSDDLDDVETALRDVERCIQENGPHNAAKTTQSICIETEAFDPVNDSKKIFESDCFQYKHGTIRNRSGEPDSRFDIRKSPSRGKINIDSAASQALSGFQGKASDSDSTDAGDNLLPLLAVATNGKIKLETLSWLGAIARRYGLEGEQELGRTASRRPRLS